MIGVLENLFLFDKNRIKNKKKNKFGIETLATASQCSICELLANRPNAAKPIIGVAGTMALT